MKPKQRFQKVVLIDLTMMIDVPPAIREKWRKGEKMKARSLTLLIALFAIMTMLFVSCNSDVTSSSAVAKPDEELVYASFTDNSKALSIGYDVPAYETLYWRYSAKKTDSYGTYGQTWEGETENFVPVKPAVDNVAQPGLDGKIGPFSQGQWTFGLEAYKTCTVSGSTYNYTDLVFKGSATGVILNKNQTNYIAVTVTPAGEYGKIKISDAYYGWAVAASAGTASTVKLEVSLVRTLPNSNDTQKYTYSEVLNKDGTNNRYPFVGANGYITITGAGTAIPAGVYTAIFRVVENTDAPTIDEFAIQTISFTVYGGFEVKVSGNLTEGLSYENYLSVPEQEIASTTSNNNGAASFVVDKTPSTATGESIKTTVVFPNSTLTSNTQHTLSVDVTTIETAETQFVIINGPQEKPEVAVAAIGLELTKTTVTKDEHDDVIDTTTVEVSDFEEYVTITTFIQDGLTGKVTVVYDDPNEGTASAKSQPIAKEGATSETADKSVATMYATDSDMGNKLGYSAESGMLRFKTDHFSAFYVKTDGLYVKNVSTGRYYPTLQSAVDAALEGQILKLLRNIELKETVIINKTLILDGDSKTITTDSSKFNYSSWNVKNTILISGEPEKQINVDLRDFTLDTNVRGIVYLENANGTVLNVVATSHGSCPIWAGNGDNRDSVSVVLNNCTMTNDYIVSTPDYSWAAAAAAAMTGAKMEINGGTYSGYYGIYVFSSGGEIVVNEPEGKTTSITGVTNAVRHDNSEFNFSSSFKLNGGSFNGKIYLQDAYPENVSIAITGGNYNNFENIGAIFGKCITGGTFDTDPSAHVADGYFAEPFIEDETVWYTVKSNDSWTRKSWFTIEDQMTSVPAGYVADGDTILISTNMGFAWFAKQCNSGTSFAGKTVRLTDNIDLLDYYWTWINGFKGSFDGGGHTISNIYIEGEREGSGYGLFGNCPQAVSFCDVNLVNIYLVGNSALGSLVGETNAQIDNIHVSGHIEIGVNTNNATIPNYNSSYVGGIAGHGYMRVRNSSVVGDDTSCITDGRQMGGIVGFSGEGTRVVVDNCTVQNITICGKNNVGGIIGWSYYGNSVNNSSVSNVIIDGTEKTKTGFIAGATYEPKADQPISFMNDIVTDSKLYREGEFYTSELLPKTLFASYKWGSHYVTNGESYVFFIKESEADLYVSSHTGFSKYVASLNGIISAAADGSTIVVQDDEEIERINLEPSTWKEITLDLNGHTITVTGADAFLVNNAKLTVKDSLGGGFVNHVGTDELVWLQRYGILQIDNGAYTFATKYSPAYMSNDGGTLIVNGGDFTIDSSTRVEQFKAYVSSGSTVTINGDTYTKE